MNEAPNTPDLIRAATDQKLGLVSLKIPERLYPIWLRAGTGDAAACIAALAIQCPDGLRIPYEPLRILEIGAGAGYRSIALAAAFPEAEIIAAEGDPALQRINQLNTLPYRNITPVFAAIGTEMAQYAPAGRGGPGDGPVLVRAQHGPVTALPLADLLRSHAWEFYDTLIITPDNISRPLLRGTWPDSVRLIAVFTAGKALPDDITACYPEDVFLTRQEGDYTLFFRRAVAAKTLPKPPLYIFNPEAEATTLSMEHVSAEPWGYFPIGAHGFRLHPNSGGWSPARLRLSHLCLGYKELRCQVRVGSPIAKPVKFAVRIEGEMNGERIGDAEITVPGGTTEALTVKLRMFAGTCRIIFSTQMAEIADSNGTAWAEFIDPVFC
jgi:hypothetical protein